MNRKQRQATARLALAAGPYYPTANSPEGQAIIDALMDRDRFLSRLIKDVNQSRDQRWRRRAA